jgi:hypothetical protein
MSDKTVLTAIIAATAVVIAACLSLFQAEIAARQNSWEAELRRRDSRLETYQKAIDLLTDFGWRYGNKDYDTKHEFTIPFVRAANRVRLHGSPATIAAMDEIQQGLAKWNQAKTDNETNAATNAIGVGLDHLVDAARVDVGPKKEDGLLEVPYIRGAGPRT